MNTSFDMAFQKLPHLNWLPWIGTNYNPDTLPLILGESHYDDGDGWLIYKNASRSLVTNQGLNSDKKEFSTSRFFRQIEKTTLSKASTSFKDRQAFWNKVAFYNLVQRLLPSRMARPDDADFDLGWDNFFHIVEVLKPKIVIRFGKAGFGRLGYYLNNTDTGWSRTVSEFYVKDEPVINLHKNGHHLKMVITNHPTGSFGYAYQKWASVVQKEFPLLQSALNNQ